MDMSEKQERTRKVLVLAYGFPPRGGGGVQRTAKFARYLPDFGWAATVLTPECRADDSEFTLDTSLLADVANVDVVHTGPPVTASDTPLKRFLQRLHRTPGGWRWCPAVRANVLYPDQFFSWNKDVLATARRLLASGTFDVIYSTSPPVTAHLSAMTLKSEFGLPWIADFRDPWTDNRVAYRRIWRVRKAIDRRLERRVYATADAVIANTEANRATLIHRHAVPDTKVATIPNGYDESDFQGVSSERPQDHFRITYCGSAYADYTPQAFVEVLQRFLTSRPGARIRWTIAGSACDWAKSNLDDMQIKERLELLGYIPHQQVPQLLMSSHVLVQVLPPNSEHWVPGKIYEYLRSHTPILAIGDLPSEVDRILQRTGHGQMYGPNQVAEAARSLAEMYDRWEQGAPCEGGSCNGPVEVYERRSQAKQLASLLDDLSGLPVGRKPSILEVTAWAS